eukprot:4700050-Lingulodinium_polyedra.AAC.1
MPSRKQLTTITHQGRPVRGVVMAEKEGIPIGAIKMSSKSWSGVKKSTLAATNDDVSDDQLDDVYEQAQKRRRVTVKAHKDNDEDGRQTYSIKQEECSKRKRGLLGGDSSDEDLLGSVWGGQFKSRGKSSKGGEAGEDDDDEAGPGQEAKRPRRRAVESSAGSIDGGSSEPGQSACHGAGALLTGSPSAAEKANNSRNKEFSAVKINKELDSSDTVVMQTDQMFNVLMDVKL